MVDREPDPGGVPRHCDHTGFGLQDLRRALTGPAYARLLTRRAEECGARIHTSTTVTGLSDDGAVTVVGPDGIGSVRPRVVLLATGARERPRPARLVPGDRPAGVFTTGQLQQWVVLHRLGVGRRAVVVGAEHVAYSAVLTLRHAGVATVAMVTELPRHQTVPAFALAVRVGLRVPSGPPHGWSGSAGTGAGGVDVEDLRTGAVHRLEADTVVFTGDWVPTTSWPVGPGWSWTRRPAAPGPTWEGAPRGPGCWPPARWLAGGHGRTGRARGPEAARRLAASWADDGPGGAGGPSSGLAVTVARPLHSVVPSVVDPADRPERLVVRTGSFLGPSAGGGPPGRVRDRAPPATTRHAPPVADRPGIGPRTGRPRRRRGELTLV